MRCHLPPTLPIILPLKTGCYLVTSGYVVFFPMILLFHWTPPPLFPSHPLTSPTMSVCVTRSDPLMDWKFMLEKKKVPRSSPPSLSLSESQNKRRRRHTAPLMATLGSATEVSLNRLVHHFAFVHHDRELCVCVCQWSFSTLCFYPQMDVPLVGLFFLECIMPLTAWIIFKTRLFIDLCLQRHAYWPVFAINVTLRAPSLPCNYVFFFLLMLSFTS